MIEIIENIDTVNPFLRWAGGKRWFIKHLENIKISSFNNYHEPFLGSGAVFFHLNPHREAYLSDLNEDLIITYNAIKENVDAVLSYLKTMKNDEDEYYKIRQKEVVNIFEHAAKFIFLNKTSFNGIYRVNRKGMYNVPYGFRKIDYINEENLRKGSDRLKNVHLSSDDFYSGISKIKENDLVFIDPPYTVSHNNNGFIEYNEKIFSLDDQKRLSEYIDELKSIGAYYILTNAAHETIIDIFDKGDRRIELDRASTIGGTKAVRGKTSEYIFTNTEL